MGHPVGRLRSVLIGGTNGKGSTAALTEALLRGAGLRTGLFTSPHLVTFRERIRIDGDLVSESAVVDLFDRVIAAGERAGYRSSFFETAWAMAALAFCDAGVDVVVWEVGLGGRLDATNICDPEVSAVVTIDFDHIGVLGPTLADIAREKAAIFRPERPCLTAAQGEGLDALLQAVEGRPGIGPLRHLDRDFGPASGAFLAACPLPGAHQHRNVSLAHEIVRSMGIVSPAEAIGAVGWPGRAQRFEGADGLGPVIVDCAHNPQAAHALATWVRSAMAPPVHLIFGATHGKDIAGVASHLAPLAQSTELVTMAFRRGLSAEMLRPAFDGSPVTVGTTLGQALQRRPHHATTLVAGSCFLAGEAVAALTGQAFPERGIFTTAR